MTTPLVTFPPVDIQVGPEIVGDLNFGSSAGDLGSSMGDLNFGSSLGGQNFGSSGLTLPGL